MLDRRKLFAYCAGHYITQELPVDYALDSEELAMFIEDNLCELYGGYAAEYILTCIEEDMRALTYFLKENGIEVKKD